MRQATREPRPVMRLAAQHFTLAFKIHTGKNQPRFHNVKEGNDQGFLSGNRVGPSFWMAGMMSLTSRFSEGRQGTVASLTPWKGALQYPTPSQAC